MDFEKEYKEMVARAKELHESGNALTRMQMEIICPGLAESEDERIRKAIRLVLIATEDDQKDFYSTHGLTRKDCTDWLEKRKMEDEVDGEVVKTLDGSLRVQSCILTCDGFKFGDKVKVIILKEGE